ncbi:MAG TPA: hypothetical protein VMI12_19325 [Puia sp.]|nr:hypothetical protein [Puia sp.]
MEQLIAFVIEEKYKNEDAFFEIRERNIDDSIFYDILLESIYLFSISVTGEIIFNSELNDMDFSSMNRLIDKIITRNIVLYYSLN